MDQERVQPPRRRRLRVRAGPGRRLGQLPGEGELVGRHAGQHRQGAEPRRAHPGGRRRPVALLPGPGPGRYRPAARPAGRRARPLAPRRPQAAAHDPRRRPALGPAARPAGGAAGPALRHRGRPRPGRRRPRRRLPGRPAPGRPGKGGPGRRAGSRRAGPRGQDVRERPRAPLHHALLDAGIASPGWRLPKRVVFPVGQLESAVRPETGEPGRLLDARLLLLLLVVALGSRNLLADAVDNPALQTWSTIFVSIAIQALPFLVLGVLVSGALAALVPPGWLARAL